MTSEKLHAVTGAFGFSGKHITRLLIADGHKVVTLTSKLDRPHPYGDQLKVVPFDFDNPDSLAKTLAGVDTLFNTYWIRFNHRNMTFDKAVANSAILFAAAKKAGVRKIVHVSITNPDANSSLPYFSGKAQVEKIIKDTGLAYSILRPAVIFGREGILINNIAWMLRLFPFLPVPGDGNYKLQPIYVEDLAKLAVESGANDQKQTIDAIGPDTFTYNDMVRNIAAGMGRKARLLHLPPMLAYLLSKPLGMLMGDNVLTKDEVTGLLTNTLTTNSPPAGDTKLSDWVMENADWLGNSYLNELKMHY